MKNYQRYLTTDLSWQETTSELEHGSMKTIQNEEHKDKGTKKNYQNLIDMRE